MDGEYDDLFEHMIEVQAQERVKSHKDSSACSGCSGYNVVFDPKNGIMVCTDCGVVADSNMIDTSAEWTCGPDDALTGRNPSRCGGPVNPLLEKSSMSTMMGKGGGGKYWLMKRIHQQNSMDYVERARWHVFEKIGRICETAGISPSVASIAKEYYKELSEKKLSRGGVREGLVACCILYSCKLRNVPRSVKEIAEICKIDTTKVNNAVKIFESVLADTLAKCSKADEGANHCIEANDMALRLCCKLNMNRRDQCKLANCVRDLSAHADSCGYLVGKTPTATTAAMLVVAVNKLQFPITKKELVAASGVSLVTINKICAIIHQNTET